jgi:predicted ATPase/DNA-binding CsgD family transcriptional regulator
MYKGQPADSGLPTATSEFVGRQAELHRINALLCGTTRLLTLVGPGGIGKTRLAAEALHQHRAARPRRIFWTRLARLAHDADAAAVTEEIARSIARSGIAGQSAWEVLVDTLARDDDPARPASSVLVLDNCEHVLEGAGTVIANLLEAVPGLTITATSREPIGWVDEQVLVVPPLPTTEALTLFRRRAELADRPIGDTPDQLAIAERICKRVDNNPLFVRIAAARLRHQPLATVLSELTGDADDKRLQWSHGTDERHRGVRDVIAWSYHLCEPDAQLLLDRMSVFAAGYEIDGDESGRRGAELDAVVAVCADDALPAGQIEGVLERLVERSLVSAHLTVSTAHYYLLESVRVFATNRLAARAGGASGRAELAARHRRYYRDKVVAGQAMWYGPREQEWLNWARLAWDNILVAIETGLATQTEAVVSLEITTILMSLRVPFVTGANRAITRLAERALAATRGADPLSTRLRIAATALLGWIALWQGRSAYTARLLDECAAVCLPDPELRRRWRDTTDADIGLPAPVEFTWGLELMLVHLDPKAITVLDRARRKYAEAGDRAGEERSELFVAYSSALVGDAQQALDNTLQHLEHAMAAGSAWATAWALIARSNALRKHGDAVEARDVAYGALAHHVAPGDTWTASWAVGAYCLALTQILADRLAAGEEPDKQAATEIARLHGGFVTQHKSMGIAVNRVPMIAVEIRPLVEIATAVLGTDGYAVAARQGALLRPQFDELQRYVLGTLPAVRLARERPDTATMPSLWDELSAAERDVAVLAAAGWPNRAIASHRGSSVRTVEAQLASIRQKLMISSRSEIIWHVPDELDDRVRIASERRPSPAHASRARSES